MEPGTAIRGGRYRITRLLGEGSQASTYAAVDVLRGREVAVKQFRVKGATSWKEVELAEREAAVLRELDHPLLPRFVEHFEEGGELFLVTELVEGESLAVLRKKGLRLSDGDILRMLGDLAEALHYLHFRSPPVIHRDIKPGNVMRRADGRYVLVDFGAVRAKLEPKGGSTVVGTFGFMAPEQFQGRAMPQSDVYSVGATMLALITGVDPDELPHKGLRIDVDAALGSRAGGRLAQALAAMVDPDPDTRPKELGPIVAGLRARGFGVRVSRREEDNRRARRRGEDAERAARRAREESERAARRAARRAERERRRGAATRPEGAPPELYPPAPLVRLVIAIVRVAVLLVVAFAVPTLLSLLSLVLGRPLRVAAARVRDAGMRAADRLGVIPDEVEREERSQRVRVDVPPPPTRVEPPRQSEARPIPEDEAREAEAEDEARAAEEAERARRQRRS
jgi:hypothetical protein